MAFGIKLSEPISVKLIMPMLSIMF